MLDLYLIADPHYAKATANRSHFLKTIEKAIQGGITLVQLRYKGVSSKDFINFGLKLRKLTNQYGIPLIVNDRVDIALAVAADGVHLGQDDMPVSVARRLLDRHSGEYQRLQNRFWTSQNDSFSSIIGASVKTVEQAKKAQRDGADYLGVGPIFATQSKADAGKPIGLKRLTRIVKSVDIPVVGIGGITASNAASLLQAGASGIAVISAIMGAKDPEKEAKELYEQIRSTKSEIRNKYK